MSDNETDNHQNKGKFGINLELSQRELLCIGKIVALWGAIEHEIFCQTLDSFEDDDISNGRLPKTMNNMKFSNVLELWKTRMVNKATGWGLSH